MFSGWGALSHYLANFDKIFEETADMVEQAHILADFRLITQELLTCLIPRLRRSFLDAPNVGKLLIPV
jgi:hypothetical protein